MVEGFLHRHLVESREGNIEERTSRGGKDKPLNVLLLMAEQGLENGAVLTVHGEDLGIVLFRLFDHNLSSHD